MKKLRIDYYKKPAFQNIITKDPNTRYYDLNSFNWNAHPERKHRYWYDKYILASRVFRNGTNWIFEDILTDEDMAWLRAASRTGFSDPFMKSKTNREYVKFAEELPNE